MVWCRRFLGGDDDRYSLCSPGLEQRSRRCCFEYAIGCLLLYFTGLIGAETKMPTVRSGRIAFGRYGSYAFSVFNIIQLLGWTAIMIIGGSAVLRQTVYLLTGYENSVLWTILIGALVAVWVAVGFKNVGKINIFAVGGIIDPHHCFELCCIQRRDTAGGRPPYFGAAVELSIAMPLSWLPLIGDYTRESQHQSVPPLSAPLLISLVVCGCMSSAWPCSLRRRKRHRCGVGRGRSRRGGSIYRFIFHRHYNLSRRLFRRGQLCQPHRRQRRKSLCFAGPAPVATVLAIFFPMDQYESFLYLIGSFFVPMVTLLLMEYFIYGSRSIDVAFRWDNAVLWVVGFILYRIFSFRRYGGEAPCR